MNKELTIVAVQMDIIWEDYDANLQKIESYIKALSKSEDIIIFPEMFLTGFSLHTQNAIESSHPYIDKLGQLAKENRISIAGSIKIIENKKYYNRFYYFFRDGSFVYYDKRHLFRMGNEHKYYSQGDKLLTIEVNDFKIRPFICYDLRFPVWMRNKGNEYDVAIVVASWPAIRIDAWKALLKARAIENQVYVIGVNRTGIDGNGVIYSGGTMAIDFKGEILLEAKPNIEETIKVTIDKESLINFKNSFPAFLDADNFQLL